ncbi:hypothetical protein RIF29_21745 [Crotalaria pallida]|uniref:Phytocyanin domain-containing protein n=1 Tax=Crotalaria pallida TaxID=3830 RepID=A0AAN9F5W0_CROPI
MANLLSHYYCFLFLLVSLLLMLFQFQTKVQCYQYKVGDLDAWGIPTSSNPQVYAKWSKYHNLTIGDSLLFLYPPSQDSVIQVTKESYKSCNLKNPILYMNNGNSLFNITSEGLYYFTSGEPGHCQKNQKLVINVGNVTANFDDAESPGPSSSSYPTVFGNIPVAPSASLPSTSASTHIASSSFQIVIIGFLLCGLFSALNVNKGIVDEFGLKICMLGRNGELFCSAMQRTFNVGPKEDRQLMTGLQQLLMFTVLTATKCLVETLKYDRAYEL